MWNPELYLRYADERGRPFHELIGRINVDKPRLVLDLGCGPGNLTETLLQRWPGARIHGVDSSPEMIAQAQTSTEGVSYEVGDVREYEPADEVDVIVTNATLQWVPGHDELLRRWVKPGRWIAMQVPANFDAPGHLAMRELAESARWADRLGGTVNRRPVGDAVHYGRLLREAGCEVDAWETNYVHQLPVAQVHPVLTWMSGTALRPIRKALSDGEWEAFSAELERELWLRYPPHGSVVDFPFLRVFAVAHR
ncbi:MAG TPA: trans-aconitate 2-methyltransferase [Micromonosporaceae bacterium]|nr:trans-aconitate 2-methyltransferase [Micromonosporaceae bacterium]